jgi:hypothetical protein
MIRAIASLFVLLFCLAATPAYINPVDYGVTFGGPDDSAAWQRAIEAANSLNLPIQSPCGTSRITTTLTVSASLLFEGGGLDCTLIELEINSQIGFSVVSALPLTMKDLTIHCVASDQIAISVHPIGAFNAGSSFTNVRSSGCNTAFSFTNAATWGLHGVIVNTPPSGISFGVIVGNVQNGDIGDSVIDGGSYLSGLIPSVPGSIAILQYSSGGLKIANSKIIGWDYGYLLDLAPSVWTSDLLISNNSFEWNTHGAIAFHHQGSGAFSNVVLTGNQIGLGGSVSTCIQNRGGANWLSDVVIAGNRLRCNTNIYMPGVTNLSMTGNF